MGSLSRTTVLKLLIFAVGSGLGALPARADDRGDEGGLGWMLAQGYGDPYAGRGVVDPYTGRGYVDPNAGRGVVDPYTGRGYVDPNAGRGVVDPYTGRGYVDPNTGRCVVDPYTGRGYVDPNAGRGVVDPYSNRGYRAPYVPSVPQPAYDGSYPPNSYPVAPPQEYRRDAYRPVLPAPQPGGYGPSPQVLALSDQLIGQVDAFLQVFAPTAGVVPEGRQFLADAQRLRAAASNFRQLASSGADPAQLSSGFRTVEALYQNLAQRTGRIAKGRTGANIQQIGLMGQTIQQLRLSSL